MRSGHLCRSQRRALGRHGRCARVRYDASDDRVTAGAPARPSCAPTRPHPTTHAADAYAARLSTGTLLNEAAWGAALRRRSASASRHGRPEKLPGARQPVVRSPSLQPTRASPRLTCLLPQHGTRPAPNAAPLARESSRASWPNATPASRAACVLLRAWPPRLRPGSPVCRLCTV